MHRRVQRSICGWRLSRGERSGGSGGLGAAPECSDRINLRRAAPTAYNTPRRAVINVGLAPASIMQFMPPMASCCSVLQSMSLQTVCHLRVLTACHKGHSTMPSLPSGHVLCTHHPALHSLQPRVRRSASTSLSLCQAGPRRHVHLCAARQAPHVSQVGTIFSASTRGSTTKVPGPGLAP